MNFGERFATEYGFEATVFPPNILRWGNLALYKQCESMIDYVIGGNNLSCVIVFWNSRDTHTRSLIDLFETHGLDVNICTYTSEQRCMPGLLTPRPMEERERQAKKMGKRCKTVINVYRPLYPRDQCDEVMYIALKAGTFLNNSIYDPNQKFYEHVSTACKYGIDIDNFSSGVDDKYLVPGNVIILTTDWIGPKHYYVDNTKKLQEIHAFDDDICDILKKGLNRDIYQDT